MNRGEDRKFELEAIQLLDGQLSGLDSSISEEESGVDRKLLLKMYRESKSVVQQNVQQNVEQHRLSMVANAVCGTCIRVARCAYLGNSEAIINGKTNYLESNSLFVSAKREFEYMQELLEQC